jgi:serine/threonine protein kinase
MITSVITATPVQAALPGYKTCWGRLGRALGEGSYGKVHVLVDEKEMEKTIVAKVVTREGYSLEDFLQDTEREIEALSRLKNTGSVCELLGHRTFVDNFGTPTNVHMYMKRYECTLEAVITDPRYKAKVDFNSRLRILVQVTEAVKACHSAGIVHRDIKPNNILVSGVTADMKTAKVVLADFGLSKEVETKAKEEPQYMKPKRTRKTSMLYSMECYTMSYRPFELLGVSDQERNQMAVSPSQDVWALGYVMVRVLTGGDVFDFESLMTVDQNNIQQFYRVRVLLYYLLEQDKYSMDSLQRSIDADLTSTFAKLKKSPEYQDAVFFSVTRQMFSEAKRAGVKRIDAWPYVQEREKEVKLIVERLEKKNKRALELILRTEALEIMRDLLEETFQKTKLFCDQLFKSCRLPQLYALLCMTFSPVPDHRPDCDRMLAVLKNSQNIIS